jgi:hypothetical protein
MNTPIARIELALRGRWTLIGNVLQAVFGKSKEEKDAERMAGAVADPEAAALQIMAFVGDRQRKANRQTKK